MRSLSQGSLIGANVSLWSLEDAEWSQCVSAVCVSSSSFHYCLYYPRHQFESLQCLSSGTKYLTNALFQVTERNVHWNVGFLPESWTFQLISLCPSYITLVILVTLIWPPSKELALFVGLEKLTAHSYVLPGCWARTTEKVEPVCLDCVYSSCFSLFLSSSESFQAHSPPISLS